MGVFVCRCGEWFREAEGCFLVFVLDAAVDVGQVRADAVLLAARVSSWCSSSASPVLSPGPLV